MDADDLIKNAFVAGGGVLDPENFYALEGKVTDNTLNVIPLQDFQTANILHFVTNRLHDSVLLGIFTTREAAEEHAIYIRTLAKDQNGNIIK